MTHIPANRAQKWFDAAGKLTPGFDNPAFQRMSDVLLKAMIEAGGPETNFERTTVQIQTLAMSLACIFQNDSDDVLLEQCANVGKIIADETLKFRKTIKPQTKKAN